ncbi:hypothetical protein NDU88_000531 [Pleurodeles waltl]|uniref:Uncharacterized protein n=1 Tax=Pleurodeles waltl TaxID=8319 RepID=A0AAV7LVS1_PLEWA|nr:hypothetical protein NDU88_000528 [Pleurodeles waltl]KAJ1095366.1 hypothetical protein NDU88_000531 [Pleurodeles waltl]
MIPACRPTIVLTGYPPCTRAQGAHRRDTSARSCLNHGLRGRSIHLRPRSPRVDPPLSLLDTHHAHELREHTDVTRVPVHASAKGGQAVLSTLDPDDPRV